jgi:adenosylcobinamide kinase/adenosylcobinamide-phosphate guanylyltransferase
MSRAQLTLVLGGARSGKSRYAEGLIADLPPPWTYIATAQAWDDEMRERVAIHRSRRGSDWRTVEEPVELPKVLAAARGPVLVDCLTLWLTNLMLGNHDLAGAFTALEAALVEAAGPVVLVSNEVGLGIVPDNALARAFRDEQGRLNQRMAALAGHVVFMAAGLPMVLK